MFTLTVLPRADGFRLAFNRDESTGRPAALPPGQHTVQGRTALMPVDPVSGGTWLAVNDAGLTFALLNRNDPGSEILPRIGRRSRGLVIPRLLGCGNLGEAQSRAEQIEPDEHAPFRLVVVGEGEVVEFSADGTNPSRGRRTRLDAPRLWTSSGLGDQFVETPRRQLFEEMLGGAGNRSEQQDAFHRHTWPGREHLSVCMSRHGASTVSKTIIDMGRKAATVIYHPDAPDQPTRPVMLRLSRSLEVL